MSIPTDRRFSETHEWYAVNGDVVTMGITQYAADELTDITYVELPQVGAVIKAGGVVGEIESVKATSELNCALAGKIVEVNEALADRPELLNEDAFESGWIVKIAPENVAPLDALLDAAAYGAIIA